MKHGRINERNTGNWSVNSTPKTRKTRKQPITEHEKEIALIALKEVYESLEYDPDLSDGCGQLNPNARFSDGGRVLLNFSRVSFEALGAFIEKLENGNKI